MYKQCLYTLGRLSTNLTSILNVMQICCACNSVLTQDGVSIRSVLCFAVVGTCTTRPALE